MNRNSYRYEPVTRNDEDEIRTAIIRLVTNYGRVGYRMVTYMLRNEGILINHKRVERIWRQEGLKLPKKQVKKRRLWLTDGNCIRLRAEHKNHVWSYDFVEDRTSNGRKIPFL
ncbi:transposase, partial [Candidatus Nomurabacteria bacterium]|nr:transposase [Candidatus Nomurabacteria bacterium]